MTIKAFNRLSFGSVRDGVAAGISEFTMRILSGAKTWLGCLRKDLFAFFRIENYLEIKLADTAVLQ